MIRTTLVLPEPLYEELRLEAFQTRSSLAGVIRMRLERASPSKAAMPDQDPILALAELAPKVDGELLTSNIDAELYGG